MNRTTLMSGAGCYWWFHDGAALNPATFPDTKLGASTPTHTGSELFGARIVVIYGLIISKAAAGKVITILTNDASGTPTGVVGFTDAIPADSIGTWMFPGGLRIESTSANVSVGANGDVDFTVFYNRIK